MPQLPNSHSPETTDQVGVPEFDRYREFFERSADAILILDDGRFVDCNAATVAMLRYRDKVELLQTHPSQLSPEFQSDGQPSFAKANEMIALAFARGNHRFEWDHLRADGSVFPVEVLLTPISLGEKQVLHVVWRDISERRRLESDLRHSQKMEALGQLTGGIAHDFNNFLMAINGYSEMLELDLAADSTAMECVEQIKLAGKRATRLVRQMLAFSRKQLMQPRVVELNKLLADTRSLLLPLLGENMEMVCRFHPRDLNVWADPGQLEQVIVNLATNARDAMNSRGTLYLETGLVQEAPTDGGPQALLSVTDSGQGMDRATMDRIFDPFFTTKEVDHGTGLGLSMVHGIVVQNGGEVEVQSTPGKGSVFKVYLPISSRSANPEDQDRTETPPEAAEVSATVLLVEDEPAVSRLIEKVLQRAGYQVFTADNGVLALELMATGQCQPNLLLADVMMPKMGGVELARQMKSQDPDLKVLFISGYTAGALSNQGQVEAGVNLLLKPFSPAVLLERIRETMALADPQEIPGSPSPFRN